MKPTSRRNVLSCLAATIGATGVPRSLLGDDRSALLPDATPQNLPRWRGFNLLGKFHLDWSNQGYREEDFRFIRDFGFNFARLPIDYRTLIQGGNWRRFDPRRLRELDQAIQWGKHYGVHVCLNFHRAPGFTVADPKEKTDLWTDPETQAVAIDHWRTLAKRYQGTPSRRLSFNLFNEPVDGSAEQITDVTRRVVAAIDQEDSERLVIVDGLQYGSQPVAGLFGANVAQACRGYAPNSISHFQAQWLDASDFGSPQWPEPIINGYLYGQQRSDLPRRTLRPFEIQYHFSRPTRMRLRIGTVSSDCRLVVRANASVIWDKLFRPGPGTGDWKQVVYSKRWKIYENVYDRDYFFTVPAGTRKLELSVETDGWISLKQIELENVFTDHRGERRSQVWIPQLSWGDPAPILRPQSSASAPATGDKSRTVLTTEHDRDRDWLWKTQVEPWARASKQHRFGVIVGEFGCYNKTPHDVALDWMEDCLVNYRKAGFGWALWNLRGPFGVLDSQRSDVDYEPHRGHRLDRKMLDLLMRY